MQKLITIQFKIDFIFIVISKYYLIMCVYDNCPYNWESKYAHRKRFAAMKKKPSLKDNSYDDHICYDEDKILSTKVNWEVAKEYFKNHKCISKYKL